MTLFCGLRPHSRLKHEYIMKHSKNKNTKSYKSWKTKCEKKNLLKQWSVNVRNRDNNQCVVCNSPIKCQAHHLLNKELPAYKHLRLELNNGITLCSNHHKMPHKDQWCFHRHVWKSVEFMQNNRQEQYKWIMERI